MHSGYRKQYTLHRHKDIYLVKMNVPHGIKGPSMLKGNYAAIFTVSSATRNSKEVLSEVLT